MIRWAHVLPLVLVAGLTGCCRSACPPCAPPTGTPPPLDAAPARRPTPGRPIQVAGTGYEGAIFASAWSPSEADVRRLEARLPFAWRSSLPDAPRPLAEYFRQYVGVVDSGGRRRIHVHGIHRDAVRALGTDPRTDEWLVADGGDSFFEAVYDPEADRFDDLGFHGEA